MKAFNQFIKNHLKFLQKNLFWFLWIILAPELNSQVVTDTMYFNNTWGQTTKDNARYYRIIKMDTSGEFLFYVTDYYLSGQEQMTGTYRSIRPDYREGTFTWYYENGDKQQSCEYKNNLLHGLFIEWFEDGQVATRQNFRNGLPDGPYKKWNKNGLLTLDAQYENGEKHGHFITYYDNGQMIRKDLYNHDRFVEGQCYSPEGDPVDHFPYLVNPQFKGGNPALRKYLHKELKYPKKALKELKEDIVWITITVKTDGEVVNPRIFRASEEESFNEEALRIASSFPRWIPGKIDNKLSQLDFTFPVEFIIR